MAYLHGVQQHWTQAEKYARQAFALDSSFANRNVLAWVLVSGNSDPARGIDFAEKALASKPEDWAHTADVFSYLAIPEHTLGLAYLKSGEHEKAVQYMEEAVAFAPDRPAIREDVQRAREILREVAGK